jgi:hypothetical protein
MTTLVFPAARHDNITASEHRQSAVRFARRALHPSASVILGMETTTPGSGSLTGRVGYQNLSNSFRQSPLARV